MRKWPDAPKPQCGESNRHSVGRLRGYLTTLRGCHQRVRASGDWHGSPRRRSLALIGDYGWTLGGEMKAHVGASFRHLSGQTANYDIDFVTAFGRQRHVQPYNVIDLNAGVTFGRFDLEAYVKNLGNSHGVTSITALTVFGPSPDTGFPIYPDGAIGTGIIRPRTVGLTVGTQF